ncbi:hypothetical protein B0J12DRAFT_161805 [Macrophomina phaseolina]|uniref:Uncharacterized protein n=1 Tax=Macrophomina phaseolina TaxID=35725 RepID=A0ABQ8GRV7_9PEZI|nr:hypothetical protein B0J12DRAFT_161805 [Macrophomina phaseolina]
MSLASRIVAGQVEQASTIQRGGRASLRLWVCLTARQSRRSPRCCRWRSSLILRTSVALRCRPKRTSAICGGCSLCLAGNHSIGVMIPPARTNPEQRQSPGRKWPKKLHALTSARPPLLHAPLFSEPYMLGRQRHFSAISSLAQPSSSWVTEFTIW